MTIGRGRILIVSALAVLLVVLVLAWHHCLSCRARDVDHNGGNGLCRLCAERLSENESTVGQSGRSERQADLDEHYGRVFDDAVVREGEVMAPMSLFIALRWFASSGNFSVLLEKATTAIDRGWGKHWIYYYQGIAFLETGDPSMASQSMWHSLDALRSAKGSTGSPREWEIYLQLAKCEYELGHYAVMTDYYFQRVQSEKLFSLVPGNDQTPTSDWDSLSLDEKILRMKVELTIREDLRGGTKEVFGDLIRVEIELREMRETDNGLLPEDGT